jgi:hypothetical protein
MKLLFSNFLFAAALVLTAAADQVELTDGSLIRGRILTVDGGKISIETSFAGTVSIALASVTHFTTDEAVHVSVGGSPAVLSRIESAPAGVRVAADGMKVATAPAQVAALWRQGAENPAEKVAREIMEKARRKWAYEATAAVTGRTGTSEKLNATAGFKATLASSRDRLILSVSGERAHDKGVKTADRNFGGADYSSFYSPDQGWYVRSALESDEIKALDLRSSTAIGFTRKLIRKSSQDLEFRSGASYLYEDYSTGKKFNSPGLDFTLLNTYNFRGSKLTTTLAYAPTFRDFSNYHVRHESALELPLTASLWKLKLGMANEFQSVPPAGVDKFDTTYFTSLLLNWK